MIEIVCYGRPAPQGSKRFVGVSRRGKGKGIMIESSSYVKPWRDDVRMAALRVKPDRPLDGALRVRMVFTVRKPASAPRKGRAYPRTRPDLSKLARSTEDALTSAGLWTDDGRVTEYARLAKVYPNEDPEALDAPGVRIIVEQMT